MDFLHSSPHVLRHLTGRVDQEPSEDLLRLKFITRYTGRIDQEPSEDLLRSKFMAQVNSAE